jgi:1,4-alpha-glucan branching enzyme
MWEPIYAAEARMESLARRYPEATSELAEILKQAARELLLLQSSDWPFLVTTGQAGQYAIQRFHSHVERFKQLADLAESERLAEGVALAREFEELDKVFPTIDYHWFGG